MGKSEDNKENAGSAGEEKKQKTPIRPVLGSRKSTRSVLIEQKIREFELVNTMLQAAMTADGADGEEQESITHEVSSTIAKLKSDLAKVREFEHIHGRVPTEAELEDVESVKEESEPRSPAQEDGGRAATAEALLVANLQNELAETKARAEALERELAEVKAKAEDSNKSAELEKSRVQEATEVIRAEHAARLEELTCLHESRVQDLESSHQKALQDLHEGQDSGSRTLEQTFSQQLAEKETEVERLKSQLEEERTAASTGTSSKEAEVDKLQSELEELRIATAKDQAAKDAEIQALKLDLEAKNNESAQASQAGASPSPSPASSQELVDAQQKLEAAQARHKAAKENAKSKIARLQEEFDNKVTALEGQHKEQISELKDRLEKAEQEVSDKQKELAQQQEEYTKISDEMSRQGQVIQTLKSQVLDFQQANKAESDAQSALVAQLQDEVKSVSQEKADAVAAAASSLEAAEKAHAEKILAIEERLNHVQEELKNAESLHENKLQEVLRKSADNLSAANAELETTKSSHTERLQSLEAELQKANESATAKQAEHEETLSALQKQLDTVTLALDEATTKHETLLKEQQSMGNTAKEEVRALKSVHEQELDRVRVEYQTEHGEEIAALKASYAEQVQHLEQKLHSSQKELAALKETHANQVKQLEQQMKATLADLETLEAGHIEELNRVKAEAEELQRKAAEDAELKHSERVRQLEQQLESVTAELSEARSTFAKQLEDLERQKGLDQGIALDALKESHSSVLKDLEDQLKSAQEAAERAKTDYVEQQKQLKEQFETRHAEELESLRTSHSKALEEVETKAKFSKELAVEEARSSLLEENRQLESQVKSLRADLDGTRFQIQSLKGILKSMEEETEEKDQEHAASLEKLEQELSMSVMRLAEQSARMMDLQMQHDQALAETKKALEEKSQQEIESLRTAHENALAELRSTLETEHKHLMEKVREEYAKSEEASQGANQSQHDELQKRLKEEYASQLDEVMKTLEGQWKTQVDVLEEQNDTASAQLAEAIKTHEEALKTTKSEHEAAVAQLHSRLQEAQGALQDTTELDGLRSQVADAQKQLKELEQKHAEVQTVIQDRDSSLTAIKEELGAAREAAKQRKDPAEVEELNNKYIATKKALEEAREHHERAVRELKTEYDAKLEKLLTELNAAKESTEQAQVSDATELQAITASLEDAKRTITSLQFDLDGAMLEVETQRSLADEAKKEAEQLKQLQKQAEVVALPNPNPRRKSRSPRRKSMNPLSPGAPKLGLESSKWAAEQDQSPGAGGADVDAAPPAPAGLEEAPSAKRTSDTATEINPDSPDQPHTATGKRNVAGQLAGIQEQIKQLDDLSEDFLEEHQKMAKMLSRVDDGTTSIDTIKVEEDETEE